MDFKFQKIFKNKKFLILAAIVALFAFILFTRQKNVSYIEKFPETKYTPDDYNLDNSITLAENIYYKVGEAITESFDELGVVLDEQNQNIKFIRDNISGTNINVVDDEEYHTVQEYYKGKSNVLNTTLSGIAVKYNTTVSQLKKLNPHITNKDKIYVGDKIRVS